MFAWRLAALLPLVVLVACSSREPRFRGAARTRAAEPAAATARPRAPEPSREGWNVAQIDWVSHDDALRRARLEGRTVCVVMHADWCGHCRNYAHVFEDPRIVDRSERLLMVRVDVDAEPEIASRYAADGGYVPRTYFLAPDGSVLDIDAHRERYRHFFDEHDPSSLLAGMDAALAR